MTFENGRAELKSILVRASLQEEARRCVLKLPVSFPTCFSLRSLVFFCDIVVHDHGIADALGYEQGIQVHWCSSAASWFRRND